MDGSYTLGIVLTILGGVALAAQSGINATLGSRTGSKPFASVISFLMGATVCLLYLLIDTAALRHQLPSKAGISGAPWWSWIGGALGAYYVVIVIIFAQKLGAGTLTAVFVCAQLLTSIVLDLTGIVGFARRVFSWQRWLGATLMIAGVVLVSRFPGDTVESVRQQLTKEVAAAAEALSPTVIDMTGGDSESSTASGAGVAGRRLLVQLQDVGYATNAPSTAAAVDATATVLQRAAAAAFAGNDQKNVHAGLQDRL